MGRGALNGGYLARSMAPPGTTFQPPQYVARNLQSSQQSQHFTSQQLEMSDDELLKISDSSDDELLSAHIAPSVFEKSKPAAPAVSKENSFKSLTGSFAYNGSLAGNKRSGDSLVDPKRPVKKQTGPARAQPVVELTLDDIPDFQTKQKIKSMIVVLPFETISRCEEALRKSRGDQSDALAQLVAEEESRPKGTIDLTFSDDDELPSLQDVLPKAVNKPAAKRQVEAPARSIREKYSTAQTAARHLAPKPILVSSPPPQVERASDSAAPRRRRLVQGRRAPGSPKAPSSPLIQAQVVRPNAVQVIESDDDNEASQKEEDELSPECRDSLLHFINTCTAAELFDLSGQPLENVEQVMTKRPFKTMNHVRSVIIESTTITKAGRPRKAPRKIGDRMVDACEEMWGGYEAVDELVAQCAALGKPVTEEMNKWGINVHGQSGELEMVDIDSAHDSGIGTPTSTAASADIDDEEEMVSRLKKNPTLLRQPQVMSSHLVMKDYQVAGLNWLALLYSKKLSCILADDMGLGKTCQVISFLSHLYEIGVKGPHLVVVPGSTLENWLREFQNFSPTLRVEPYYGAKEDRVGIQEFLQLEIKHINVIVTTYDTAAKPQDARFLRHLHLGVCVYDEGHALKNSESKRYKELMRIPAEFRLLLTGTPLQNNLQELISLLAFIMPDVFRGQQEKLKSIFKHKAKTTDDSSHAALLSADRIKRARSMMTPFILRRKKYQVLKHLPGKIRRVEYCDMTENQKTIYDSELSQFRKDLLEKHADADETATTQSAKRNPRAKATTTAAVAKAATNVMMKLRQAAIHPLLRRRIYDESRLRRMARDCVKEDRYRESNVEYVFEDLQVFSDFGLHKFCLDERHPGMAKYALKHNEWMDSGKVSALVALLQSHKANGARTLVFSQFTMVLDILEDVLETIDVPYVRLDGSTKMEERQERIDLYHSDPSIQVFLLSTKAGGAGINLACANKVVIFDSSFNPQDDIQAENRAHRVGQSREVEVVRLVTRDTIEEQIHALGESKLALDERVAGVYGASVTIKEDGEADVEGESIVERMMREKLVGTDKTHIKIEDKPKKQEVDDDTDILTEDKEQKTRKDNNLKDEFLDGLEAAGLNMKVAKKN